MDLDDIDCTDKPGFAAGRYEAGALEETHCAGLASVEFGVPIAPTTRMNLGSFPKQFTAWAVALLERDIRLDRRQARRCWISLTTSAPFSITRTGITWRARTCIRAGAWLPPR